MFLGIITIFVDFSFILGNFSILFLGDFAGSQNELLCLNKKSELVLFIEVWKLSTELMNPTLFNMCAD